MQKRVASFFLNLYIMLGFIVTVLQIDFRILLSLVKDLLLTRISSTTHPLEMCFFSNRYGELVFLKSVLFSSTKIGHSRALTVLISLLANF